MAIEAAEIERASSLASDLAGRDVSELSQADLLVVHDAVARLGRLTDTLQARFAGEIARRSIHVCPGAPLARLELRVLVEELLARTSELALAPDTMPERAHYPGSGFTAVSLVLR